MKEKQLNRKEIQNIEFEILLSFDRFCKDNNLRYYLCGGTLLGAIRHKGVIPWDDDIDVCMPRPDYEKFIELFDGCFDNLYVKSNRKNNFYAPFSKVVNNKTRYIDIDTEDSEDNHLWIDVMPVDGLPNEIQEVIDIYNKCNLYRWFLVRTILKYGVGASVLRKYSRYLIRPLARLIGAKRCTNNIESIALKYSYDFSNYVGIVTWGLYGAKERMVKSEFESSILVEFEGHYFPAFSCWEKYLTNLYGDYLVLPPIEKRQTHNIVAYCIE